MLGKKQKIRRPKGYLKSRKREIKETELERIKARLSVVLLFEISEFCFAFFFNLKNSIILKLGKF